MIPCTMSECDMVPPSVEATLSSQARFTASITYVWRSSVPGVCCGGTADAGTACTAVTVAVEVSGCAFVATDVVRATVGDTFGTALSSRALGTAAAGVDALAGMLSFHASDTPRMSWMQYINASHTDGHVCPMDLCEANHQSQSFTACVCSSCVHA
eukprot:m.1023592 g.1023592  ORF g.1023592 m.1023592 type:complete len:156 (+) comp24098_c0_seq4:638-1105(+)